MTIRRIIVGLEPRPRADPLIAAAAALAERLPAELLGLFVENVELLHFAGLPFAREVGLASGARRPLGRRGPMVGRAADPAGADPAASRRC